MSDHADERRDVRIWDDLGLLEEVARALGVTLEEGGHDWR